MKNNNYYGVYSSPYLYDGEPYVGSPKDTLEECYSVCGTDERCLIVFNNEHDAEEYRDIVSQM